MSLAPLHPARYWRRLDDGRFACELCPRGCRLRPGQRAYCFVREATEDGLVLSTYGRSTGFCLDPIEKKPLHHFLPGTPVLSFGTAGCNLGCRFCQNWDTSRSRETDRASAAATPEAIARAAVTSGARSVAFTYNDPVVWAEYAIDTALACREAGVRTVAVTAGYVSAPARADLFAVMDAANVDLKAMSDGFYRALCSATLAPVLETIAWLVRETPVWVELTTLLVPGHNDSEAELHALSAWVAEHLGPDVPLHLSAFHPAHRLTNVPRTPLATLTRARRIAREHGLHHVYTGNVHDPEGDATRCSACDTLLVARNWYALEAWALTPDGRCPTCGLALPGVFEPRPGTWGARRQPLAIR